MHRPKAKKTDCPGASGCAGMAATWKKSVGSRSDNLQAWDGGAKFDTRQAEHFVLYSSHQEP